LVTRYLEHLVGTIDGTLEGMTVALDCAHGASVTTARTVFEQLGANVVVMGETPDGANINDGVGSTHPEALADLVRASKADIGLAFDGDADRVVAVDHTGVVVDGDTVLALFAHDLQQRGQLHESTVVVTVMSNLGFYRAMANADIAVRTVAVGDRNVVEALDAGGLSLGGEQSGHIIFRSLATTGDGVLSGLLLADLVKRSGTTLAVLSDVMLQRVPQYLEAVRVQPGSKLEEATELNDRIDALQRDLGDRGRILVRASGTEPVIRVMVEADDDQEARQLTKELVDLVQLTMGTPA
jgi:phosphoglucosamine mutase